MNIEKIQEKLDDLEFELQEGLWEISNGDIGTPLEVAVKQYHKHLDAYIRYSKMLRQSKLETVQE